MKNRRIVVLAIMLVAVLCLGVGYAALNDDITATGTVNIGATGFDLDWAANNESAITTTINDENDTLTFTISAETLTNANPTVTIKAKVANTSTENFNAKITGVTVGQSADYSDYYQVSFAGVAVGDVIAKGASQDVTITVTLKQMPLESIEGDTFTITINAEALIPTA